MAGGKNWEDHEDGVILAVYPQEGAHGVRKQLPHRTLCGIRRRAQLLKVPNESTPRVEPKGWGALPATNLTEQLDCVVLRKWRGPVNAGPLVATIGRAAA